MLKAAIVGTGNIAPQHVKGLLEFPERVKIVALCDIYPEKAEKMKEQYHLDCEVFDDHQKMIEAMPDIDIVHVCTPPYGGKAYGYLSGRVRCHAGGGGEKPCNHGMYCPEPFPQLHL